MQRDKIMVLFQRGYECEREIKLFYNMFFNKDDDVTVTSEFKYENKIINVYTVIEYKNRLYNEDYYFKFDTENKSEKTIKKVFTAACTKSFVHASKKIKDINLPWGVMCGVRPAKNVRELYDEGFSDSEVREIFKTVYEVSEDKIDLSLTVANNEKKILKDNSPDKVGIYIGIPFCPTRCVYCSFVSTDIRTSGKYMNEFSQKLVLEIKKTAKILKKANLKIESIYIGGGTPTALDNKNLELILKTLNSEFDLSYLSEFTLEAGRCDTITEEKLKTAKKYGVDRISINPQTMNDKTLVKVNRCHTAKDVIDCFNMARNIGFYNINMDLIAGLPDEDFSDFKHSRDEVIKLNPDDITVHSMCIKYGARLNSIDFELTKSSIMNKMLSYMQESMKKTGRVPYYMYRQKNSSGNLENVGYSYPNKMGRYNVNIMEEKQTIIALGGGGSTKIVGKDIQRIFNFKDPKVYIDRFDEILAKKDEILKIMEVV